MQTEINHLKECVEKHLPELVKACKEEADIVVLHQDAFAADYQVQEYVMLGMAVKYIGLTGKTIHIIGKNRETIDK